RREDSRSSIDTAVCKPKCGADSQVFGFVSLLREGGQDLRTECGERLIFRYAHRRYEDGDPPDRPSYGGTLPRPAHQPGAPSSRCPPGPTTSRVTPSCLTTDLRGRPAATACHRHPPPGPECHSPAIGLHAPRLDHWPADALQPHHRQECPADVPGPTTGEA
ncbi:hypothetical protein Bbelb_370990, partial [Branchiostoma belcheri]